MGPGVAGPTVGGGSPPLLAQPQPAILIRWSKKDEKHPALLMLASGLIAFRKARGAALQAALVAA